jgi:hypothetical protein
VEFNELPAEGQPQTGPFRFLVSRPHLAKLLEHCFLIRRSDATPVSLTETSTDPSLGVARTSIRPPSGVNLIAFDNKFSTACWIFRSSA